MIVTSKDAIGGAILTLVASLVFWFCDWHSLSASTSGACGVYCGQAIAAWRAERRMIVWVREEFGKRDPGSGLTNPD